MIEETADGKTTLRAGTVVYDLRYVSKRRQLMLHRLAWVTLATTLLMFLLAAIVLVFTLPHIWHGDGGSAAWYGFVLLVLTLSIGSTFLYITRVLSQGPPESVRVDNEGIHFTLPGPRERLVRWDDAKLRIMIADYGSMSGSKDPEDPSITWADPTPPIAPLTREAFDAILGVAASMGLSISQEEVPRPPSGSPHVKWIVESRQSH
ncbi:MAG: hypothetical protein L3K23_02145 [Thermoplasmata archaeon]|nr:hypothetical protein [Thermoplasmata archaeon]